MKAKSFDSKFEKGEDVTKALDLSKARRPLQEQRRVNVDFPACKGVKYHIEKGSKGVKLTRSKGVKCHIDKGSK